jgi:hypothetical protein
MLFPRVWQKSHAIVCAIKMSVGGPNGSNMPSIRGNYIPARAIAFLTRNLLILQLDFFILGEWSQVLTTELA